MLINGTNGSTGKNANRYHILTAFQKSKPMSEIAAMLPGVKASDLEGAQLDTRQFTRMEAIIQSMTPAEREDPKLLNSSRKKRIAAGSGTQVVDVNRLLKQFEMIQTMTRQLTGRKLPKHMRRMMGKGGKGFPGMGGMGGGFPGMPF